MKFKRLLSGVLAVTVAISSLAMSAFTALAAETDNVELKFTQGDCTSDGGKMKYAVDGSWAPKKVMEADSLAYLKSGSAEIKTITGTVTVTGTVAEPFYMYLCYADGSGNAYWGEGNSANKKTSEESPLISEAGTYEFTLTLDEVTSPTAINYIGFDGSANSFKNNPDAVVHADSIIINKTASESSSKIVITDFAGDTTFVDSEAAGYQGSDFVELMINDTYNNTTILTDDQKAKITAIADSIKTITYEIEVTGTVASEFTILPCVNGGSWNIARGSNPGGMFINNYNCTVDKVKVTGPGTYTVTTTVNEGISSSEILNKMWYLTSLEYHSKSFNPDMVMKLKSLTVEGAAAVTPELDYTALDKAITDGEAVDTTAYTEASVKVLTDAIAAGKAVKENADATQDDVDAAAKAITDAIAALEEKPSSDPSDIVLPDSGAWSRTSITNSAKLEFSPYSGNGNAVSALSGKNEFYATFTVTGVPEGGVRCYLPTVFIGGGSHWNADDVVPFVEIPTDGTYTVKFSGEAIPDPAKLQYCGINFKGLTNTTDVKVGSIELKYVTLSDPSSSSEDPNKIVITDFAGDTTFVDSEAAGY